MTIPSTLWTYRCSRTQSCWHAGRRRCTTASPGVAAESGSEHTTVHLFVNRHRTVPATDHSGRQAIISCGAVLDHLRIAMTAAHWQANITRFPQPNQPDQLATVEFSPIDHVTAGQRNRAQAILQRRTDRLPFDSPMYWHLFEPSCATPSTKTLRCLMWYPTTSEHDWW